MSIDIMQFFNLVKFIFALMQGNYVTVTEFSRFIEFFLGVHTNTVNRVNKMLCKAGYEAIATELSELELNTELYRNIGAVDMYYVPRAKGLKWSEIAETEAIKGGKVELVKYLKWNPKILFEIFNFTFDDETNEISKKIIETVKEYDLINSKREIIDKNILRTNISVVKRILELAKQ